MGNSIQESKQKYKFLNQPSSFSKAGSRKDLLLSTNSPNNFVLINSTSQNFHYRMYHQNSLNPDKESQLYEWRNLTSKPIPKLVYVEPLPSKHPKYVTGFVYTEHLVKNLASLSDLQIDQALYLLKTALIGFEAIFRILGSVTIDLTCCGINQKGQCKVWINQNLSKNLSQPNAKIYKQEPQIIHQTLRLFRQKTLECYQCFFISLEKHIDLFASASFKEVENFIDSYAETKNIKSSRFLTSRIKTKSIRDSIGNSLQSHKNSEIRQHYKGAQSCHKEKSSLIQKLHSGTSQEQLSIHFPKELRKNKEEVAKLEFSNHQTDRKYGKRNSVLVSPATKKREMPQFLSKKSIQSPKIHTFKFCDKQNTVCNTSIQSEQQPSTSGLIRSTKSYKFDPVKQDKSSPSEKRKSLDPIQMNSLNNILTEITERNQDNSLQKDTTRRHKRSKSPNKIQFCHQFSINIINDCSDYKSQQGRKMNGSNLSTNKTNINSNRSSSPHKHSGSMFWDTRRKHQPYNSQFIGRGNNSIILQNNPNQRRRSGEKDYNFGNIMVDLNLKQAKSGFYNCGCASNGHINEVDNTSQNSFSFRNHDMNYNNYAQQSFRESPKPSQIFNSASSGFYSTSDQQQCINSNKQRHSRLLNTKKLKIKQEQDGIKQQIKEKQQQIINANSWKKTIDHLIGDSQSHLAMNKSISYGDDIIPSPPIRLQKLGRIGREISSSIIPIPE